MIDKNKTKDELLKELQELRQEHEALKVSFNETINEQKIIEKVTADEVEHFHALLTNVPVGLYIFWRRANDYMEFVYLSDMFCEMLQVSREEALGDAFIIHNHVHKDDYENLLRLNMEAARDRKTFVWEGRIVVGSEVQWYHIESIPIFYDNGDSQWYGAVTNITDRKQTEMALHESGKLFRSLANIAADSILLFEGEKLVYASNRFCEYVGIEQKNIDKLALFDIISHIHPDDRKRYGQEMQESLVQQKERYTIEYRMLNPEGKYEWLQNNTTATYDSYGKALHRIVQVRDITQMVEMEIKLRELNAQKDKFFSIIAHDLTNPFNTIIGFIDLLIEEIPEKDYEKIEEYAKLIEQSSQQTMSLLTNLLEWSRANTGSIAFYPDFIELNVLIEENKTLLDFVAAQKGITIKTKLSQNLTVYADKPMINTVLRNLISNAIKFTNRGGEIIVAADKMGEEIIVSVSDNGIGISHERLEKIFRIDENNSTPGTNKEKGTGLGLILCKEFIEKHGGKIWVECEQGMGTVFYFTVFSNSR